LPSTFLLPSGAAIVSAALMLMTETPAHDAALKPAHVRVTSSIAEAGGVGQARAYWHNLAGPAQLRDVSVRADAPEDQIFQSSGSLVLRTSSDGVSWVTLQDNPTLEHACTLSEKKRSIDCALPAAELDQGAYYSVAFPTFVSPGARVTSASVTTSNAILTVEGISVESVLQTFVGSRSTLTNRVDDPAPGHTTITGLASAGSTVALVGPNDIAGHTTSDASGRWSIVLRAGFGMVQPWFTDVSGRESATAAFYYNSYEFTASPMSSHTSRLQGKGQPGSQVDVLLKDTVVVSTHASAAGLWQATLPVVGPLDDDHITLINTLSNGSTTRLSVAVTAGDLVSTLTATEGERLANGTDVHRATMQVADAAGRALEGVSIVFEVLETGEKSTLTTDSAGQAIFSVSSTTPGARHIVATNTVSGWSDSRSVLFKAAPAVLSARWTSVDDQHDTMRQVRVTLVDGAGSPIAGEVVKFSTTVLGEITATTAVTDRTGEATMTVASAPGARFTLTAECESTRCRTSLRA
jgi:hypothetical protein